MIPDWLVIAASAALLVLAVVVVLLLLRDRSRTRAELAATRAESSELRTRVDALTAQLAPAGRDPEEFVITHVGDRPADLAAGEVAAPERIDGRLFADLVLRESVVKAAGLTHGVRRALAPEARNRIRFEMRQEIKRSRKHRRDTMRSLRREMQARERGTGRAS